MPGGQRQVWVMALNPAEIKIHTRDLRGLVAALLVWIVVLVVGGERPLWQVLLGSAHRCAGAGAREHGAGAAGSLSLHFLAAWLAGRPARHAVRGDPVPAGECLLFPGQRKFWAMRVPDPFSFLLAWQMPEIRATSLPEPE